MTLFLSSTAFGRWLRVKVITTLSVTLLLSMFCALIHAVQRSAKRLTFGPFFGRYSKEGREGKDVPNDYLSLSIPKTVTTPGLLFSPIHLAYSFVCKVPPVSNI